MNKKIIYIILLLVGSVVGKSQNTAFSGGLGTETYPYLISTPQDLKALSDSMRLKWNECNQFIGNYFLMTNDIDLINIDPEGSGAGFIPVGVSEGTGFAGIFDGGGYKIRNLIINRPDDNYIGLFGYIAIEGVVKNITIETGFITGANNVAAIAGGNRGLIDNCNSYISVNGTGDENVGGIAGGIVRTGKISNCFNAGSVEGVGRYTAYIGGIAGYSDGVIDNCRNMGTVKGRSSNVGGVAGQNNSVPGWDGFIVNSENMGLVVGSGIYVGGVVGDNFAGIKGCYNLGKVSGTTYVGGITGDNGDELMHPNAVINNCFNRGNVHGNEYVGGITGWNENSSKIINVYNTGTISCAQNFVGGIAGNNGDHSGLPGIITNAYNMGYISSGNNYIGGITGQNLNGDSVQNVVAMNFWNEHLLSGNIVNVNTGGVVGNNFSFEEAKIDNSFNDPTLDGTSATREMLSDSTTYTDMDWDFVNDWQMGDGYYNFPVLKYQGTLINNQPDCPPIAILSQPKDLVFINPVDTTLKIVANSLLQPLTYSWRKIENENIHVLGNTPSLQLSGTFAEMGQYFVMIENACSHIISDTVDVTFLPLDSIRIAEMSICETAQRSIDLQTYPANFSRIMTLTSSDTTVASVNAATGMVTGIKPGKTMITARSIYEETAVAEITVDTNTTILQVANTDNACENENVDITADVIGRNISYQWYRNNNIIPDNDKNILTITAENVNENDIYKLTATGICGEHTKDSISIALLPSTVITKSPHSVMAKETENVILEVEGDGDKLTYQWYKDGQMLTDHVGMSVYWLNNISFADSGQYYVVLSGTCGEIVSEPAVITVISDEDNHSSERIAIYPSSLPKGETIGIYLNGVFWETYQGAKIQVYNILGEIVQTSSIINNITYIPMDVPAGVYMIWITKENNIRFLGKVIVW